ncbi:MAG: phosphatidylserine/phosphatidylglycerophosphate/cardiolipin synthase family protein [Candidatus Roizmanbacteria bacterium]|nr:phosphatidylserine/phosphatidylglycerophosphate/cardiolipin synthase family protein [Candidatus Roizmanbacteria bacterium]
MNTFEIQSTLDFFQSFTLYATGAKKSIWIQTMNFDPGIYIDEIVSILIKAAKKGIDVRINVDWLAERFYRGRYAIVYIKKDPLVEAFNRKRQEMYTLLRSAGVKLTLTNKPNLFAYFFPSYKRNHIKMFIVDNKIAWVGGVNLMKDSFENLDLMVKTADKSMIHALIDQFPRVNGGRRVHDYITKCNIDTSFMVDSGRYGKSLIYQDVLKTVEKAKKSILFISQFPPDGLLQKKIIELSRKGVKTTIITSHRNDFVFTSFPQNVLYNILRFKINNNSNIKLIHFSKKVHIKLLIVDFKHVVFGSHNFSQLGGLFGTEEIAFHTTNTELISGFKKFIATHIDT